MAEPEELITDVARHATIYARGLWRRHRPIPPTTDAVHLRDVSRRLDLLISAVFGTSYPLRVAQPPAPPTMLARLFRRRESPWRAEAVPATDGVSIWLPVQAHDDARLGAFDRYRVSALRQAMRASRGSVAPLAEPCPPLVGDLYLLVEAHAADAALVRLLPGMTASVRALRSAAAAARPPVSRFALERRGFEAWLSALYVDPDGATAAGFAACDSPAASMQRAHELVDVLAKDPAVAAVPGAHPLLQDWWTGELRLPPAAVDTAGEPRPGAPDEGDPAREPARAARLARRPEVRQAEEDEDDDDPGVLMVQSESPHEHAEDPFGLQRPVDRDEQTAAEDFADSLAELPEARLVSSPGRPKEYLLSDDPVNAGGYRAAADPEQPQGRLRYPEWDYRTSAYREPGATVWLMPPRSGPQQWVDQQLEAHGAMIGAVRRRFEMLRAQRTTHHRQPDGDELDLGAYIEAIADFRAGLPLDQALYESRRPARRDLAMLLLIDVSGSTDGWVAAHRRIIDVEREALLLVCIALDGISERYAVHAFSGEGPERVQIRTVKDFDERYGNDVARRIAALEPERYTRAGAAIRHATALLMQQRASHRLLLLLSDGKPNDVDTYDGRYGIEDMRQSVVEAKLQGVAPFCLTIDQQGAGYLPGLFGAGHYALLPRPELLPAVLLDWIKRLVAG